jgi:hypothetical protein
MRRLIRTRPIEACERSESHDNCEHQERPQPVHLVSAFSPIPEVALNRSKASGGTGVEVDAALVNIVACAIADLHDEMPPRAVGQDLACHVSERVSRCGASIRQILKFKSDVISVDFAPSTSSKK